MDKGKNIVEMSFEGQHESLPNILEVNIEEENLSYNEEITSGGNEEIEKFQRVENKANEWKALVSMEDESTSLELHERIKYEALKTIPEMAPWG